MSEQETVKGVIVLETANQNDDFEFRVAIVENNAAGMLLSQRKGPEEVLHYIHVNWGASEVYQTREEANKAAEVLWEENKDTLKEGIGQLQYLEVQYHNPEFSSLFDLTLPVKILNLTMFRTTSYQRKLGIIDIPNAPMLRTYLTFGEEKVSAQNTLNRAKCITKLATEAIARLRIDRNMTTPAAIIQGEPWLLRPLVRMLKAEGILPLYEQTDPEVVKRKGPDGKMRQKRVYKHRDFIAA